MMKSDDERIEKFKTRAKPEDKFMTINISSWHMSIFPEFHVSYGEIEEKFSNEKKDPMGYSYIDLVYDLKEEKVIWGRNMH